MFQNIVLKSAEITLLFFQIAIKSAEIVLLFQNIVLKSAKIALLFFSDCTKSVSVFTLYDCNFTLDKYDNACVGRYVPADYVVFDFVFIVNGFPTKGSRIV